LFIGFIDDFPFFVGSSGNTLKYLKLGGTGWPKTNKTTNGYQQNHQRL